MVYIAGLDDVHSFLRRVPVSHAQGVEGIVWLTTFAGVYRGVRSHAKGRRHRAHARGLPANTAASTGVPAPDGANIGEKLPTPLLVRVLSPVVHGAIVAAPAVYLLGTAWNRMEQPEWLEAWSLPHPELTVGKFAALRTLACVANYGVLYILKRVRKQLHAAVGSIPLLSLLWELTRSPGCVGEDNDP